MRKTENTKIDIPKILFSILPISIIIGPSFSLINTVLFSLCFIFIYFSRNDIKINDFKPVLLLFILYLYLIFNSLISVDITSTLFILGWDCIKVLKSKYTLIVLIGRD